MDLLSVIIGSILLAIPAAGATEIVVYGRIFQGWRERRSGRFRELISCSQCTGFHAGWIVWAVSMLPAWTFEPVSAYNWILGAALTGLTSSLLAFAYDMTFINP